MKLISTLVTMSLMLALSLPLVAQPQGTEQSNPSGAQVRGNDKRASGIPRLSCRSVLRWLPVPGNHYRFAATMCHCLSQATSFERHTIRDCTRDGGGTSLAGLTSAKGTPIIRQRDPVDSNTRQSGCLLPLVGRT
jgi:hypothetical protein